MQTEGPDLGLPAGEGLGELDDEGDEDEEIVLERNNNTRQSNRPQGERIPGCT